MLNKIKLLVLSIVLSILLTGCVARTVIELKNGTKHVTTSTMLYNGIVEQNEEKVICAIESGADVNYLTNFNLFDYLTIKVNNPLFLSILTYGESIPNILIENGADINYKDKNGVNILMISALKQNYDMCETLVKKGIDINEKDNLGRNCIDYALVSPSCSYYEEKDNVELAKFFYSKGVDISDYLVKNVVEHSNDAEGFMYGEQQFDFKYEIINWLIDIGKIKQTDLSKKQNIFYNVYLGNLEKIKKLDDKKLKQKNSNDEDFLMVAAKYGQYDIVRYLISKGISPENKVENYDGFFSDSIVYAASSRDLKTLKQITKNLNLTDEKLFFIIESSLEISQDKCVDEISYLVDLMENSNYIPEEYDENILALSCRLRLYKTSKMLIDKGFYIDEEVFNYAVDGGDTSIVSLLIENCNDLSIITDNEDLLYRSIEYGNYDMTRLLIKNGAKVNRNIEEYIDLDSTSNRLKTLVKNNIKE